MNQKMVMEQVVRRLSEELGDGYIIEMKTTLRNNDVEKTGISIREAGDFLGSVLYSEALDAFGQNEPEENQVEKCVSELLKRYRDRKQQERIFRKMVPRMMEWDTVKAFIRPALLSYKNNERLMSKLVYRRFLDLAIVYMVQIEGKEEKGTVRIEQTLFNCWGISEEELHRQALKNMESDGYTLQSMLHILEKELSMEGMEEEQRIMVLTNRERFYGAAGILTEGLLEAYSNITGQNLFLLPSSVHEFLLIPDDGMVPADMLDWMVKEVNRTELLPEDRLSDHVYFYDRKTKRIRIPMKQAGTEGYPAGILGTLRSV